MNLTRSHMVILLCVKITRYGQRECVNSVQVKVCQVLIKEEVYSIIGNYLILQFLAALLLFFLLRFLPCQFASVYDSIHHVLIENILRNYSFIVKMI